MKTQADHALSCLQTTGESDAPLEDKMRQPTADAERGNTSILYINANSVPIISQNAQTYTSLNALPTLEKIVFNQALDGYRKAAFLHNGYSGSGCRVD